MAAQSTCWQGITTRQNHDRKTCQRLLEATSLAAHARNKTMQARTGKLRCANVCPSPEKRQGPPLHIQHLQTFSHKGANEWICLHTLIVYQCYSTHPTSYGKDINLGLATLPPSKQFWNSKTTTKQLVALNRKTALFSVSHHIISMTQGTQECGCQGACGSFYYPPLWLAADIFRCGMVWTTMFMNLSQNHSTKLQAWAWRKILCQIAS
jgi:hypothetical protein